MTPTDRAREESFDIISAVAVFIELVTDAFEDNLVRLTDKYAPGEHAGLTSVRRPLRGLEVKEDTYAMIKVIRADGTEVPLVDSSHPRGSRASSCSRSRKLGWKSIRSSRRSASRTSSFR